MVLAHAEGSKSRAPKALTCSASGSASPRQQPRVFSHRGLSVLGTGRVFSENTARLLTQAIAESRAPGEAERAVTGAGGKEKNMPALRLLPFSPVPWKVWERTRCPPASARSEPWLND